MEQPGIGPWAFFALGKEPEENRMTTEEVDELVEIMTVGVPEEQRYPVPERARATAATAGCFQQISAKRSRAAASSKRTSIARRRTCSDKWSVSAGSITRRDTR